MNESVCQKAKAILDRRIACADQGDDPFNPVIDHLILFNAFNFEHDGIHYHVTRDGTPISLSDIAYSHLVNIISYIDRLVPAEGLSIQEKSWHGDHVEFLHFSSREEILQRWNFHLYQQELNRRQLQT
jgi:hypothetical protein